MSPSGTLDRRAVVARLLRDRGALAVVTGLGSPTYDVAAVGDHPRNFYLWGAMGGAAVLGLGLALAQPGVAVLVITGDGEVLMGLGGFATIALKSPANLRIAVIDNGLYGETGGQASHTAGPVDLAAVARGCGLPAATIMDTAGVDAFATRLANPDAGVEVAVIRVASTEYGRVLPPRDGALVKNRLRVALGVEALAWPG